MRIVASWDAVNRVWHKTNQSSQADACVVTVVEAIRWNVSILIMIIVLDFFIHMGRIIEAGQESSILQTT